MKLKTALTTGILASSMLFMFTGCSKDDDNRTTNTPTPVVGTMTAKVDGVAWSSMTNRVGGSIMNGVSGINGVANDSTMITVSIQDIIAAGDTIDIGDGSSNGGSFALDPNGSAASGWVSQGHPTCTGTFIVTALDTVAKKMSGTFNFKAFRPLDNTFKNITDGVFTNVTYATTISTSGNSTFTVKIDGTTFTPAAIVGTVALGNLQLTASDNQGSKSVGLTLPETVAPGTYPIGTIGDLYYGSYNPNSSTFTISNTGSVTITSHNTTTNNIVGTFNFVSADFGGGGTSYALTNGAFNITY